jgi:hypothetical protein
MVFNVAAFLYIMYVGIMSLGASSCSNFVLFAIMVISRDIYVFLILSRPQNNS